jgi:hypothetical protein
MPTMIESEKRRIDVRIRHWALDSNFDAAADWTRAARIFK